VQAGWERALTETEMELKHARAEVQRLLVAGEKREVALGMNPIVTSEQQVLNMIGTLV
jgi:hypothetical protein